MDQDPPPLQLSSHARLRVCYASFDDPSKGGNTPPPRAPHLLDLDPQQICYGLRCGLRVIHNLDGTCTQPPGRSHTHAITRSRCIMVAVHRSS
jgi:hypothetical protein